MGLTSFIKSFFSPLPKKKVDFRPSVFKDIQFIDDIPDIIPNLPSGVVSSGFNSSTLKQAIDDAKTVRQTALQNAKNALNSAFDVHGIKPAKQVYKPGYAITVMEKDEDISDFDDDLDMVMGISGFNLNNNQYNSITLTGSIPASSINSYFNSYYGGTKLDSHGNPTPAAPIATMSSPISKKDKDIEDLLRNGLPQPNVPVDDGSGAVDKQPEIRTGKIARVEFDVVFGRPQWSNQIHAIKNSVGQEIYLASNQGIVRLAVQAFNDKLKGMYCGEKPVFTIESGTMFRTGLIEENPVLNFHGLRFPRNGAKLIAIFSYDIEDEAADKLKLELIGNTCQFFVLGELELDEQEERITEMNFECFGYNNPHRMNVNKELFRIL